MLDPAERRALVLELLGDGVTRTRADVFAVLGPLHGLTRADCSRALQELRMLGKADHVPSPPGAHYPIAGWGRV